MLKLKQKPKQLLTLGAAAGLITGGAVAWLLVQQKPTAVGLPAGSEVLPKETIATFSFSTKEGQWQQLRRLGTPESQATLDRGLADWRDRFLTANNLNYKRDIQPWVGEEMTVAFLQPPQAANSQQVQPYSPASLDAQTPVMVLPIAKPDKAQQILATPKVSSTQEWVDRDYKGLKIREVHGQAQTAYAASVIDNRFVVMSQNPQAVEQVIDVYKGKASIVQAPGYGQAFRQLETTSEPWMRLYLNVPEATALAANNPMQPIPPQAMIPIQMNQGFAAIGTIEREQVRFQGIGWLPSDSKIRFRGGNRAEKASTILPSDALLMASGSSFEQFWQTLGQPQENPPRGQFNPDLIRQSFNNLTGLDFDKDMVDWMDGEFSLALISAPPTGQSPQPRAGVLLLAQTTDRRKADAAFQKLDKVVGERYRYQVTEAKLSGQPVVTWVSPFGSLSMTRGWLDSNVAFLAIGPNLASTILPASTTPLAQDPLFQSAVSSDLKEKNGQFFVNLDRLANPNVALPLPKLPANNQKVVNAIRAIGVTTAIQDGRTMRYDIELQMNKSPKAPGALPAPQISPSASPAPAQ